MEVMFGKHEHEMQNTDCTLTGFLKLVDQMNIPTLYLFIFLVHITNFDLYTFCHFMKRMFMGKFYYCIYRNLLFVDLSVDNFKLRKFVLFFMYIDMISKTNI